MKSKGGRRGGFASTPVIGKIRSRIEVAGCRRKQQRQRIRFPLHCCIACMYANSFVWRRCKIRKITSTLITLLVIFVVQHHRPGFASLPTARNDLRSACQNLLHTKPPRLVLREYERRSGVRCPLRIPLPCKQRRAESCSDQTRVDIYWQPVPKSDVTGFKFVRNYWWWMGEAKPHAQQIFCHVTWYYTGERGETERVAIARWCLGSSSSSIDYRTTG